MVVAHAKGGSVLAGAHEETGGRWPPCWSLRGAHTVRAPMEPGNGTFELRRRRHAGQGVRAGEGSGQTAAAARTGAPPATASGGPPASAGALPVPAPAPARPAR